MEQEPTKSGHRPPRGREKRLLGPVQPRDRIRDREGGEKRIGGSKGEGRGREGGGSDSLERAEDVLDLAVHLLELGAHGHVAPHGSLAGWIPSSTRCLLVAAAAAEVPLSCPARLPHPAIPVAAVGLSPLGVAGVERKGKESKQRAVVRFVWWEDEPLLSWVPGSVRAAGPGPSCAPVPTHARALGPGRTELRPRSLERNVDVGVALVLCD